MKRENGKLYGLIENSFSMGWSRTNINWFAKPITHKYMKDVMKPGTLEKAFIIRLNSKKSPIDLDWKSYKKIIASGKSKKFDRRNISFKEKDLLYTKAAKYTSLF